MLKIIRYNTLVILSVLFLFSCKTEKHQFKNSASKAEIADKAMIVSARSEASRIGAEIMKKGGNAFDAMVATEMALAVSYPFAGNLGGGGFMVYRTADGEVGTLDYREKAPLASSKNMYLDENGEVISEKSTMGALASGVPGTIAGIFKVHKKFGSLPIQELLKPVIALAEKGIVVTQKQQDRLQKYRDVLMQVNEDTILFTKSYKAGDTLKNKALANTLRRIATNGRSEFYGGETGKILLNFLQERGGIITEQDLLKYDAKWRDPVQVQYKDYQIISMPPPSSGGIVLAQILKMIEPYPLNEYAHNSAKYIQVLTEAERRAYADRSFYLGDSDFYEVPQDSLLDSNYLEAKMANFSFEQATSSSAINHGELSNFYESNETTHYSIVDAEGNAVSVTTTLNGAYGSKLYIPELGFFMNNEMNDFSLKPGVPNMFGLIGAEANAIAPEKRMLSSMTPTIIEKDNKLWMVVGSPGGSTIITSVLQTFLNVAEFDLNMQEAVSAKRFHHQWLPDEIMMEPAGFEEKALEELQQKGYKINQSESRIIGKVDAIRVLPNGKLEGGADPRGDDTAVGF
ncbi:gamma-glutamyltransferase [Zunongwangia endophytica]|uniref:Glutathione hydrolase proenzyme n=1 Tax=Zunongwangia endophytica TaxID=1808945 RepID=A0ABV8H6K7_9FLAO|nr:gamma-glutamyltransferase [Zunongwangia endophytica]MDN3595949.1 gamma-glutamyltransferase [Zunongwangia endophytica]